MGKDHHENKESAEDRFNRFMFGSGGKPPVHPENEQDERGPQDYYDYEEIMYNIDTLIESAKGLKPLYNKVYPYIQQFFKKN
ncbi:MAG: hypothetical protein Q8934_10985 [Bacillota bacterium]|nr:hypothetical protein [Bacillota bacterium]